MAFTLDDLIPIAIVLGAFAIVLVVIMNILSNLRDNQSLVAGTNLTPGGPNMGGFARNASTTVLTDLDTNVVGNYGLVALIAMFVVILGLVQFLRRAA